MVIPRIVSISASRAASVPELGDGRLMILLEFISNVAAIWFGVAPSLDKVFWKAVSIWVMIAFMFETPLTKVESLEKVGLVVNLLES